MACNTDDAKLNTPFGSCGCMRSSCGCFGSKQVEPSQEDKQMEQVNAAIKVELREIEMIMRNRLLASLQIHGTLPPIRVIEPGVMSPPPVDRQLTLRFKNKHELSI